jgi:hypothetical protein
MSANPALQITGLRLDRPLSHIKIPTTLAVCF